MPPHTQFLYQAKKETQKEKYFRYKGRRNETLFDVSVRQVHAGSPEDAVKWNAVKLNSTFQPHSKKMRWKGPLKVIYIVVMIFFP